MVTIKNRVYHSGQGKNYIKLLIHLLFAGALVGVMLIKSIPSGKVLTPVSLSQSK